MIEFLIVCLVFGALAAIWAVVPIGEPYKRVGYVVIVVIFLIWVLRHLPLLGVKF